MRAQPHASVVAAELGSEIVLLNVDSGVYFGLDPVGARIWQLLGPGASADDIAVCLADEYETTVEVLQTDVADFLALLAGKGLVKVVDP